MAYNYQANKSPTMLLILAALVLLFLGNAPLGQGETILPVGIKLPQIYITGKLYCTNTGNPAQGASGAAAVRVNATCKGNNNVTNVTIGTAITNLAGLFNISLSTTVGLNLSQCNVSVALPVTPGTNCTALPLKGVFTATASLVNVVLTSLGDVVVDLVADLFS